ncbi:MAG: tetratricopeptide repeat protein, partial [Nitrospirota bacterium]
YPQALSNLGIIYAKMGRLEESISLFKRALNIDPDDTITLLNLGLAYEELSKSYGQKDLINKAIETYQKVLELDPENAEAKERMSGLKAKGN